MRRCSVSSRPGKPNHWDIVEKETIDEIIFRTTKLRNRLILELMARGGMRVGEVRKFTPENVIDQKPSCIAQIGK